MCCGCGASWSAFLSFGIRSDFEDMRVAVRQSDLPEAERDAYVRRLELAEDRFDSGEFDPSFTEWIAIEKPFDDVFSDGRVQPSERALLEEAVRKMER